MKIFEQEKNQLYKNNESELKGMFPLGKGGFWHSGIHLHYSNPITVPFEGEVVAYNIAEKYQTNSKGKNVSKSFVLMKHNVDIMKGADNTEKNEIEFFSLYTSLLPDSELKATKEFSDFKVLTKNNKNLNLPFYKDVEFSINLEKCNSYKKLKDGDYYVGTKGNIIDSSYLTKRMVERKVSIRIDDKTYKLSSNAIKIENSAKSYEVKVEKDNIPYFPTDVDSKIFFSRGIVEKGSTFFCDSEPIIVNSEMYYKIISNGNILKKKEKKGYIFQCETYKNTTSSPYAYVQKSLKYSVLYDVNEIKDTKDFFFICKYSELKKIVDDVNKIKGLKEFLSNLGFGINKNQLNKNITENINSDKRKEHLKDDDLIFMCNNNYTWNNDNIPTKDKNIQTFYDISFKDKLPSYAIFYIDKDIFYDIKKNVSPFTEKNVNLIKLSAIKGEDKGLIEYVLCNENVEIDEKNNINLITNNLLYHVTSRLPTSYDTEWLIKGSDLTLLTGPDVILVDDGSSFINSEKGLLLYDKNNKNLPCFLLDKESEYFTIPNSNSILESSGNISELINYNGKEYYINISNIEQLKIRVVNKSDFKTDTVIVPSKKKANVAEENDKSIFLSSNKIIGYASENDGKKSFDFITFTKNTDFLKTKDKLIIRLPKENSNVLSVEKISDKVFQRLPFKSSLKIIKKEEILGHYYYKVKYYLMPIWFSNANITNSGKQYLLTKDIFSVWISYLRINSNGTSSGENTWANNQQISILKDLIINNFGALKDNASSFIEKNKDGTSYCFAINFESFSNEYYMDDISNFTLDEKEQTLTIKDRSKDFLLYTDIPFIVKKVDDTNQIKSICDSFSCDEGALLKYENIDYYALVKNDTSSKPDKDYYIKKSDIEEKNLLDWNEYFTLYDKDSDDDVYYDLEDLINSCGLEKKSLEELKQKLNKITGKDKNQKKILEIYKNDEAKKCLRNLIVKHPLEFNESLFKEDELEKRNVTKTEATNYVNDMKLVSFWGDISGIDGINNTTSLFFAHPVTFFNHIDEIKDKAVPFLYEKWGSRITGKNGNIFILDNGKGKLLSNVEWYDQRDNAGDKAQGVYGYNMCQLTSLAMVMNAMGVKRKRSDCQFEDELYNVANLAGYGGSKLWEETIKVYNAVLSNYNEDYITDVFYSNVIALTKKHIDSGVPVIKSMNYKSDHTGGHVTVVVGYIGDSFIVNDPYGNRNTGNCSGSTYCTDTNGAFVEYPFSKWDFNSKWGCTLKN